MQIKLIVIVIVIAITQRIFFPLLNRVMPLFLICGRESSYHFRRASIAEVDLVSFSYGNYVTWDQAQFSFRFVNSILASKAKRKESLIFCETSAPTFLIDWHLLNQPTKNLITSESEKWWSQKIFFFRPLLYNCLNWNIYCDDHSSISSTTAVQKWIISYILHIKITSVACFF